jgi:hypothetical protein
VIGRCRPGENVGPFCLDTNTGCMDLGLGQVIGGAALLKFYKANICARWNSRGGRDRTRRQIQNMHTRVTLVSQKKKFLTTIRITAKDAENFL